MGIKRRVAVAVAGLMGAATLAWGSSPASGETVKVKAGTEVVQVDALQGRTREEVKTFNPDGSLKLLIPKGFPVVEIPTNLDALGEDITRNAKPGNAPAVPAHSENHGHNSSYRWNGVVQSANDRYHWILDRTAYGEEPYVQSMVNEINNGLKPAMWTEQGIPGAWAPTHAYYDDDTQDQNCFAGGTTYTNYSFTLICTTWNVAGICGQGASGCAFVHGPTVHNGPAFQPGIFIGAGLSEPYARRNIVWHEIGHTLGWGHNQGEADSIMAPTQPNWRYNRITYHDTWDLSNKYRHSPD